MLKEFLLLIKRFISPYKKYLAANLILNFLAQILNVFSFALLIPILQILFKVTESTYTHMTWADGSVVDVIKNNFYYYMNTFIETRGALWVLMASGVISAANARLTSSRRALSTKAPFT